MVDAFGAMIGSEFVLSTSLGSNTFNLDASGDKVGIIFQMPEAMMIAVGGFVTTAGGATPVPRYIWSLQGVDASGLPDGTIKGGGSPASVSEVGLDAVALDDHTFDNLYAAARGEFLALVGEYDSVAADTIGASNFCQIQYGRTLLGQQPGVPYAVSDTGGGWTKPNISVPPFIVRSATKSIGFGFHTVTTGSHDWNNTNETGLRFKLDAGWGSTFKLRGVRVVGEFLTAGATVHMALYSGAGAPYTLEELIELDGDVFRFNVPLFGTFNFDAATLPTLNHGTEYFLIFSSTSATGKSPLVLEFATAGDLAACPWGGEQQLCTRVVDYDTGTKPGDDIADNVFTVTNTKRPAIALILEDWTEPAGGGGGGLKIIGSGGLVA